MRKNERKKKQQRQTSNRLKSEATAVSMDPWHMQNIGHLLNISIDVNEIILVIHNTESVDFYVALY